MRKQAPSARHHIDCWGDAGFTTDGVFVNPGELHHGGMVFYRWRWGFTRLALNGLLELVPQRGFEPGGHFVSLEFDLCAVHRV
ncbi:Atu4866 domain-containing protein [Acidovorax sp. LjRoot118]|uniref:Atu4866 domain-containing protein n=1 Tax=Acidovorax sp. LjRoot118 TaxID=3342256 RepID=UPI003ECE56F4